MYRVLVTLMLVGALGTCAAASHALKLLSPTPDQVVRENVKISIPVSELPPDFVLSEGEIAPEKGRPFLTLHVGSEGSEQFVAAISPDAGSVRDGAVAFFWNSKAPYRDPQDPRTEAYITGRIG